MRYVLGSRVALPCLSLVLGIGCGSNNPSHPNLDSSPDSKGSPDTAAASKDAGKDLAEGSTDGVSTPPEVGADSSSKDRFELLDEKMASDSADEARPSQVDAADAAAVADTSSDIDGGASTAAARVLLVDKASDVFAAYDANGKAVRDYHALLDFGSGYDAPWISLDGNMARWTTATDLITDIWWLRPALGRDEPAVSSTLVIAAHQTGGSSNRIKLASMAGDVLATLNVAGDYDGYALSPRARHLVATKYGSTAIVLRLADQKELWRGASGTGAAAFSPDDKHLIAAWTPEVPFELVDLESGRIIKPALSALPFPYTTDRNHVSVKAALDAGAVITPDYGYGDTLTQQLWWVGWDGKLSPFDPSLPEHAFEDFVRWDAAATKALSCQCSSGCSCACLPAGGRRLPLQRSWPQLRQFRRMLARRLASPGRRTGSRSPARSWTRPQVPRC
jgi:hypothetical protein